jgi:hypothetical protein
MRLASAVAAALALALPVAGCGSDEPAGPAGAADLPQGAEPVELDPADFTTRIDNRYWPMQPGNQWVYRETEGDGTELRVDVRVTDRIKKIANGVEARVVRDVVTEDGVPVEVTDDWYAQDSAGNIWYLGEDTTEYENGEPVSKEGSFEAGVDGAQAGIVMPAEPEEGLAYRQEHYAGEAEDRGEIMALGEQAEVPAGHYKDVLMTKDVNPLEPKVLEFKFYAPDVGPVLAVGVSGGGGIEELLRFEPGR